MSPSPDNSRTDCRFDPDLPVAAWADGTDPAVAATEIAGEPEGMVGDPEALDLCPVAPSRQPWIAAAWRFLQLGGLAFALNLSLTAFLHDGVGLSAPAAFAIALVTVFFFTFFGFRHFVYRAKGDRTRQFARFAVAVIPFRAAEYAAFVLLHQLAGIDYLAVAAIVLTSSAVAKFVTYRVWVFSA